MYISTWGLLKRIKRIDIYVGILVFEHLMKDGVTIYIYIVGVFNGFTLKLIFKIIFRGTQITVCLRDPFV